MRNRLVTEDTRAILAMKDMMTIKRRVDNQIKSNEDIGSSIQPIDFDYLLCENEQFKEEIKEINEHIGDLKILTGT